MTEPKLTLIAASPVTGDLPVTKGALTLSRIDPGRLTLIAPFKGQAGPTSAALENATGLALPDRGRLVQSGAASIQWFGRGQYLLAGVAAPDLPQAAITDQTDGWVVLELTGPGAATVMARLVPVDLRLEAAPTGTALRTDLHGMMVAITRPSEDRLRIFGYRSMARSLCHAITDAMTHVAALN